MMKKKSKKRILSRKLDDERESAVRNLRQSGFSCRPWTQCSLNFAQVKAALAAYTYARLNFLRLAHRAQLLKQVSFSFFAEVEVGVLSNLWGSCFAIGVKGIGCFIMKLFIISMIFF